MNASTLWTCAFLIGLAVSGCRDKCSIGEVRYGEECRPRLDAGHLGDGEVSSVPDTDGGVDADDLGSPVNQEPDDLDADSHAQDASSESSHVDAGFMVDGCTPDQLAGPACSCPKGFFHDGTACQRGALDVAPGPTTCAIRTDRTLWCWGASTQGGRIPARFDPRDGWEQVDTGSFISSSNGCAIREGELYCWGDRGDPALGLGSDSSAPVRVPTRVGTQSDWQVVSTTIGLAAHTCGIRAGMLFCWGYSDLRTSVSVPTRIGSRSDWSTVSAGWDSNCGIAGGALWCWQGSEEPKQITEWVDWNEISAGANHACGIRQGLAYCWGGNNSGALGTGQVGQQLALPTQIGTEEGWHSISAGVGASCAIRGGALYCWGESFDGPALDSLIQVEGEVQPSPVRIGTANDWDSIRVGSRRACGIHATGALECFGANNFGELGRKEVAQASSCQPRQVGADTGWTNVAAGFRYSCAIKSRQLYCWGQLFLSADGLSHADPIFQPVRVGSDPDWQRISLHPDGTFGTLACGIRDNGLYCWGQSGTGALGTGEIDLDLNPKTPVRVGDLTWTEISVGLRNVCGRTGGSGYCWGENDLSDTPAFQYTPFQLPNTDWSFVAASGSFDWDSNPGLGGKNCGIRNQQLWCWRGAGPNRILTEVEPSDSWASVSLGAQKHACGIRAGQVWCWGSNEKGQLGLGEGAVGRTEEAPTAVLLGSDWRIVSTRDGASCAIGGNWTTPDSGSLWCWGDRKLLGLGDCHDGVVASPVQVPGSWSAVALGDSQSCAIASDGSLWCWGDHTYGQAGHGPYWDPQPAPVQWPVEH